MEAIILAGGLGTRLRALVPDVPKPMAPVGGRPFLAWLMDYWIEQGIKHFILSTGYRHECISKVFGKKWQGVPLTYVVEETPLGTGGGLLLAAGKLQHSDSFLLLNGDTWFAVNLAVLRKFSETNNADWCFALHRSASLNRYMGVDVLPGGCIRSFQAPSSTLVNGGVYWVRADILTHYTFADDMLSLENDIFPAAMQKKHRLFGRVFNGTFLDIGEPPDYKRAFSVLSFPVMET